MDRDQEDVVKGMTITSSLNVLPFQSSILFVPKEPDDKKDVLVTESSYFINLENLYNPETTVI